MKRGLIALFVFVFVISVSITSLFVLKNSTEELYAMIETIETSVSSEDYQQAKKDLINFTNYWEDTKRKLTVIVHLQNVENINDLVAMLDPLIKEGSKSSLLVTIARLKVLIEDLYENEFPSLHNLF